jgi:hypothetical protein
LCTSGDFSPNFLNNQNFAIENKISTNDVDFFENYTKRQQVDHGVNHLRQKCDAQTATSLSYELI